MTRFLLFLMTGILISLPILTGCNKDGNSENLKKKETTAIPVEVSSVKQGDIAAVFSGTANLEAEDEALVVAKVSGVVTRILVEEGDYVSAGQPLAQLDDEPFILKLNQAKANLDKLKNDYNRNEKLYEKNLISADAFDKVKFEYQSLKAAFDLAELELDYTTIKAPISGVISERFIKTGNMIRLNEATFKLTDFDPLHAILFVPERHLSKLKKDQEVQLSVDAIQGHIFRGKIKRISPVVDPNSGTFKVTIEVSDNQNLLKPGMFGRVNIIYDVHQMAVLVPKEAVMTEDKEKAVYVLRDTVVFRQVVEAGYTNSTDVEILNGLQPGDTVVTIGQASLKDSARVEVISKYAAN